MRSKSWIIAGIIMTSWVVPPSKAQIPFLPDLDLQPESFLERNSDNRVISDCIRLDGRCLFEIAGISSQLADRKQVIERNLATITEAYFEGAPDRVKVEVREESNLPVLYVNGERLLTITNLDAELYNLEPTNLAARLQNSLPNDFQQAKTEREPQYLSRQVAIASGILLGMLLSSWGIRHWRDRTQQQTLINSISSSTHPLASQLNKQQQQNITEVQHRIAQIGQVAVWGGGGFFILGLFPYSRFLQVLLIGALNIPTTVGVVGLGTYVVVRLSYALIDRFTSVLTTGYLSTPESSRRLQLRVSTISGVTKSITTLILSAIGIILGLMALGIDIGPLLAGAGILGVALSLASQNLIKDGINGFLIIVEDHYAIGDVIAVGEFGGLVENMNLRITQLRDAEGRLITIPNSEVRAVANLSSTWARADLSIPVAYNTDVNRALELIKNIAYQMNDDPHWQAQILESPQILGVDDFGSRGVIIRVWIKTLPLKQWDVAREFRRLLKVAFDEAGIPIPLPQQEIWFNNLFPLQTTNDSQNSDSSF